MYSFSRRIIVASLGILLVGTALPASAAKVEGLYRAEVGKDDLALLGIGGGQPPSSFRSTKARKKALMRAAMAEVLIRLSGTSQVVADPLVRYELLRPVERFVSRYQYLGNGSSDSRIRVQFNGRAVRELLWQTGWPVWGHYRPGVVVWVARRSGGGMDLAFPDMAPDLYDRLRATAKRYAVPLLVPLMDAKDRSHISGRDLLFEDWGRIRAASERYDPDAILLLRIDTEDGTTQAHWVLRGSDGVHSFSSSGTSLKAAFQSGMVRVMADMACHYAVYPGQSVTMQAAVSGVANLQDYARVEHGLDRLAAIESVTPMRVEGTQAQFRFAFQGPPERAAHILSLLDLLEPKGQPAAQEGDGKALLHFAYRP